MATFKVFASYGVKSVVVGRNGESQIKFNRVQKRINDVLIDLYSAYKALPDTDAHLQVSASSNHLDMFSKVIQIFRKHGLNLDVEGGFADDKYELNAYIAKGTALPALEALLVRTVN